MQYRQNHHQSRRCNPDQINEQIKKRISINLKNLYFNISTNNSFKALLLLTVMGLFALNAVANPEDQTKSPVTAIVTIDQVIGCSPFKPLLENQSVNATSYLWDFGDGTFSDSPDAIINHTWVNEGEEPETFQVSLIAFGADDSDTLTFSVTVLPEVKTTLTVTNEIFSGCAPLDVQFGQESENALNYYWEFGNGNNSVSPDPGQTFLNPGNETATFMVRLTASSEAYDGFVCQAKDSVTITTHPSATAGFSHTPTAGCSPLELSLQNTSPGSNLTSTWNFGDGAPALVNNQENFTYTLINEGGDDLVFPISLLVENEFGCTQQITRNVTVWPKPQAIFSINESAGCSPFTPEFTNTSANAIEWHWDFGNGSSSDAFEPSDILFVTGDDNEPTEATIVLTATSEKGCTDQTEQVIQVNPTPNAGFQLAENAICAQNGEAIIQITNQSSLAETVTYTFVNTLTAEESTIQNNNDTIYQTIPAAYTEPVAYQIIQSVSHTDGCSAEITQSFVIYPEITPDLNSVESGCHPFTENFSFNNTENLTWRWEFSDGSIVSNENPEKTFVNNSHTEIAHHYAHLFTESVYGCHFDTLIEFDVYPKPNALFSFEETQVCAPYLAEINDMSLVSEELPYQWSFGETQDSIAEPGNITYTFQNNSDAAKQFPVSLVIANEWGCEDSFTSTLTVFPEVAAAFSLSESAGCHPLDITLTNETETEENGLNFLWNYGETTSGNANQQHSYTFRNISHTQTLEQNVTLTVTSDYGCSHTASETVTIYPKPRALYAVSDQEGCSPFQTAFSDLSEGEDITYLWTLQEDVTSDQPGDFDFLYEVAFNEQPEVFETSLLISNGFGCSNSFTIPVTVYPEVKALFSTQEEGCHPHEATFSNQSLGATEWMWDFGNGQQSTAEEPLIEFTNPSFDITAEFPVTLTAISDWSCQDTTTVEVTVLPTPRASFVIDNPTGCGPLLVGFTNTSAGLTNTNWDFETETSTGENLTFEKLFLNTSAQPDTLTIVLNGDNDFGCQAQMEKRVIVYPEVEASFSSSEPFEGCNPVTIPFENQSLNASQFTWSWGNNQFSNSENPTHTFFAPENSFTSQPISLLAESAFGCRDTLSDTIVVHPQPTADFEALPHEQFLPDATVFISNYSSPGNWTFDWDMGDGNTFSNSSIESFGHSLLFDPENNLNQEFTISLQVNGDFCADSMEQTVLLKASGTVALFGPEAVGCPPLEVSFENNSLYAESFQWDFGDGNTSEEKDPVHIFQNAGLYEVKLTTTSQNGETDTATQIITVHQPPTANFRVEPDTLILPDDMAQMINLTALGETWFWNFGDGNTSTEENPIHYYTEPGTWLITLTAGNNTNPQCFHSATKEIVARIPDNEVICSLFFPNAFTPNPSGPNGGSYQIGDPVNDVFHPRHSGIQEFEMEIFNRWGERIFVSNDINTGWDGYVNGKLAPMGVYIFHAKGICVNGDEFTETGDITLVR